MAKKARTPRPRDPHNQPRPTVNDQGATQLDPDQGEFENGFPVKAIILGTYEDRRWKPGESFLIAKKEEFSSVWMEALGWEPPPDRMAKRHPSLPPIPTPDKHPGQGQFHPYGAKEKNRLNPLMGEKTESRISATSDDESVKPRKPASMISKQENKAPAPSRKKATKSPAPTPPKEARATGSRSPIGTQ